MPTCRTAAPQHLHHEREWHQAPRHAKEEKPGVRPRCDVLWPLHERFRLSGRSAVGYLTGSEAWQRTVGERRRTGRVTADLARARSHALEPLSAESSVGVAWACVYRRVWHGAAQHGACQSSGSMHIQGIHWVDGNRQERHRQRAGGGHNSLERQSVRRAKSLQNHVALREQWLTEQWVWQL